MSDQLHLDLANTIKSTHHSLRLTTSKLGAEKAWQEHCQDTGLLQNYAKAMQKLATQFWEKNANDDENKRAISRIHWIADECEKYYFDTGREQAFIAEKLLLNKLNLELNEVSEGLFETKEKIRVLDVGSCYNPFQKFPKFDVVAIDIAPASNHVRECDFLNVEVVEGFSVCDISSSKITELPAASFDVVVFSLLLEYFPSPEQRYVCCRKASVLLAPGGILCIITPDSKHATANSGIMKRWRYALANEGLLRIEYKKLPHLHCMVYRKCIHPSLSRQWLLSSSNSDLRKGKSFSDPPEQLMVIPQDFNSFPVNNDNETRLVRDNDETIASLFADLPL